MTREEKIIKRVQEHYDYLTEQGYERVFLALQGSQNYELDVYDKDYSITNAASAVDSSCAAV